jgi:hypothetical protein
MSKIKKYILIGLIVALVSGVGYFSYTMWFKKVENIAALSLVPEDAVFIVETDEPVQAWKTFSGSDMWNHVKRFKPLGDVGKMADALSKTIAENDAIFSAFGSRAVLISAHVVSETDYDFMYVCDMQKTARFSMVQSGIVSLMKNNSFQHSEETIAETTLHAFFNPADRSTLFMSFIANQLVLSYNKTIIQKCLEQRSKPVIAKDARFLKVAEKAGSGGLCRIYLNHRMVPRYLDVYMDDISGMQGLFGSMHYTGVTAEMDNDLIQFQGATSINDSMSSHLRAIALSGKSTTGAQEVFSDRAAFLMGFGFDDFKTFYNNLTEVMKQDEAEWNEFQKNKRTVEKLLGFSMEEDLLGWIGDEVTVAQYRQERVIGGKVHTVVAMKADGLSKAKEKLGEIEKRIRRRTPLKFESADYKKHEIHYLEIKGLFKMLFGKLFGKVEKPYYTYIGDYVVFCDDINTLLTTIDDFENGKTLAKSEEFNRFANNYHKQNSLFVYLNMPAYFLNLKGILGWDSWMSSYNNREFIVCFNQMGFQFTEEDGMLDTRLLVEFKKPNAETMEIAEAKPLTREQLEDLDSLSDADVFILENLTKSVKKELYDNGKVKFLAEMKEEQLDGRYQEFWENGNIKVRGKYKNGSKTGVWKFYNEDGEFDRKRRFKRGDDDEGEDKRTDSGEPDI